LAAQEASKVNLMTLIDMFKPAVPVKDKTEHSGEGSSSEDSEADSPESESKEDSCDEQSWKRKFLDLQKKMEKAEKSKKKKKKADKSSDRKSSSRKKVCFLSVGFFFHGEVVIY